MRGNIEKLVEVMNDNVITAYKVFKETGVDQSMLSKVKSGDKEVGTLTLNNAEKLSNYYEEWYKMNKVQFKTAYEEINTEHDYVSHKTEIYEMDKKVFDKFLEQEEIDLKDLTHDYLGYAYDYTYLSLDQYDDLVHYLDFEDEDMPVKIKDVDDGASELGTDMDGNYQTGMGN